MSRCETRSAGGGRHGKRAWVLLALLGFSTGAGAEPIGGSLKMPESAAQLPYSAETAHPPGREPAAAGKAASAPAPDTAVSRAVCLKEGEACNPLNDLCCPGYYCPGGLARTCAPKP